MSHTSDELQMEAIRVAMRSGRTSIYSVYVDGPMHNTTLQAAFNAAAVDSTTGQQPVRECVPHPEYVGCQPKNVLLYRNILRVDLTTDVSS